MAPSFGSPTRFGTFLSPHRKIDEKYSAEVIDRFCRGAAKFVPSIPACRPGHIWYVLEQRIPSATSLHSPVGALLAPIVCWFQVFSRVIRAECRSRPDSGRRPTPSPESKKLIHTQTASASRCWLGVTAAPYIVSFGSPLPPACLFCQSADTWSYVAVQGNSLVNATTSLADHFKFRSQESSQRASVGWRRSFRKSHAQFGHTLSSAGDLLPCICGTNRIFAVLALQLGIVFESRPDHLSALRARVGKSAAASEIQNRSRREVSR